MGVGKSGQPKRQRTFLGRLRTDIRGNVMAMSAAALVPLLAMIGGAIDASRIYMAYTRLQQSCDSGALAGRKAMATVTALTTAERNKAKEFFDFNFPENTYSATNITRDFTKGGDGIVNGTASAVMPTTIMKMFGYDTVPLSVTCQATLNIPNTDVMFVLDVTGSMDETVSGDSASKITGLRQAVRDFYAALGPGSPSGPGRIRYGFMPYSSNVNVGRILYSANPSFMAGGLGPEPYKYQSRRAVPVTEHYIESYGAESGQNYDPTTTTNGNWSNYSDVNTSVNGSPASYSGLTVDQCAAKTAPSGSSNTGNYTNPSSTGDEQVSYPDDTQTRYYKSTANGNETEYRYTRKGNGNTGTCQLQKRSRNQTTTRTSTTTRAVNWADREKFDHWVYEQRSFDVSAFVQSTGSVSNPSNWTGYYTGSNPNGSVPSSFTWGGCIEEAKTVDSIVASSSLTPPAEAYDLDIDLKPGSADTRWKPFLRDLQFDAAGRWLARSSGWISSDYAACPREASRLTQYASDYIASSKSSPSLDTYVNSLTAVGYTYHDIGLIWGARFLSPDGIFAADNADSAAPGGYQVSRHIVFMTDGALNTIYTNNDAWGINNLDGNIAPTNANNTRMNASHQRRTQIICNAMRGKGYTIWVIGFGTTLSQTLKDCASDDNHWSVASNSAALRTTFSQIAQTIGGLRLSS